MDAGTRRFLGIVAVVLVAICVLMATLYIVYPPLKRADDDDDDENWRIIRDSMMVVTGDVTWRDRELVLDHPLEVKNGATFSLEACRLEVSLENLQLATRDWITIEEVCALELVDSELVVTHAPSLDGAYVCIADYDDEETPCLWRVVDLRDTRNPVLRFDMELRESAPRVGVAIEAQPGDGLELLTAIIPSPDSVGEWVSYEVGLGEYSGSTPRVVVFAPGAKKYDVLISGITITDDGGPLRNDFPLLGDIASDGWYIEGFEPYWDRVRDRLDRIPSIIRSMGRLALNRSVIRGVPGLERDTDDYRPQLVEMEPWHGSSILPAAPRGLDIIVTSNGTLSLIDSNLSCVPIIASGSKVTVRGSGISGDEELLTLYEVEGTIRGNRFTLAAPDTNRGRRSGLYSVDWLLGIESPHEPEGLTVSRCTFMGDGGRVGIHLNKARVSMEGCHVEDLALGVWNHVSEPDAWSLYEGGLTFGTGCELGYVETRTVEIQHGNAGNPPEYWVDEWDWLNVWGGHELPLYLRSYVTANSTWACLPLQLVHPDGEVELVDIIQMDLGPYWKPVYWVTVDPWASDLWVDLNDKYPYRAWFDHAILSISDREGNGTSVVEQGLWPFIDPGLFREAVLRVHLDGVLQEEFPLDVNMSVKWDDAGIIYRNFTVPEGHHIATFSIWANQSGPDPEELLNISRQYLHVTSDTSLLTPLELFGNDNGTLLLDPGVSLEGLSYSSRSFFDPGPELVVIAKEGSRAVFDTFIGGSTWDMDLHAMGGGDITIKHLESGDCFIHLDNISLTIEECVEGSPSIWAYGGDVRIDGPVECGFLSLSLTEANLTLDGCAQVASYNLRLTARDSSVTIAGCSLQSRADSIQTVEAKVKGNSSLLVTGSSFHDTSMQVLLMGDNSSVRVIDCAFRGSSYLFLVGGSDSIDARPSDNIPPHFNTLSVSNCTFKGQLAGLYFHIDCADGDLGKNTYMDGSRALVPLKINITFEHVPSSNTSYKVFTFASHTFSDGFCYGTSFLDGDCLRFMVDVTDDPKVVWELNEVPLMICHSKTIVGFSSVPVSVDTFTIQAPRWDEVEGSISELLEELNSRGNWWSQ